MKRLEIYPNAYCNYLKDLKIPYRDKKQKVQFRILDIYHFAKDHKVIYNCSIIDVYDGFVVATLNSTRIDTKLAINTLKMALERNKTTGYIVLNTFRKGLTPSMKRAA